MQERKHALYPNIWSMRGSSKYGLIPFSIDMDYRASGDTLEDVTGAVHWHNFVQIWYTISGNHKQEYNQQHIRLEKGSLIIIPPFHPHKTYGTKGEPVLLSCCELSLEFLNEILSREEQRRVFLRPFYTHRGGAPYIVLSGRAREKAETLFTEISSEYLDNPHRYLVLHKDRIRQLLLFIVQQVLRSACSGQSASKQHSMQLVLQTIGYLEKHCLEPVHLKDICRYIALGRTEFCRIFKLYTGNTFHEYLSIIRLQHAARELTGTHKPILQIMQESGFATKSNFNQQFKALMGLTPREFRNCTQQDAKAIQQNRAGSVHRR